MPLSIYLAFFLVGAVAVACFAIFKLGRKQAAVDIASEKVEQAREALERARIAKDVRAGGDLPDDKLHFRD